MAEKILVEKMAQHHWLSLRAQRLQDITMADDLPLRNQERQFALFLRYQTANDRAFHRALNDLLKLRAERRKAEIGFESQKREESIESRRAATEKRRVDEAARSQRAEDRKNDLHEWAVLLAQAKLTHQQVLTNNLELNRTLTEIAQNDTRRLQKAA